VAVEERLRSLARGHVPVWLGLAALVLVLFWPVVMGGRVFYHRDIHLQWQPQMEAAVRAVAAGSWPLWNPSVAFGQPLLANPNNQLLYPTTWLNLLFRPWTCYTILVVSHFLLAAVGLYLLALRCGASRGGAFVASAAWISGGTFLSLVDLWNHLCGAAWIPWCALAALRVATRTRMRDAVFWGVTVAAPVLAGSPESALMGAASGVCLAFPDLRRAFAEQRTRRVLLVTLAAALFAVLLSAGQWLPSLEIARRSVRADLPEFLRSYWSLHPAMLIELIVPTFLHKLPLHWEVRGSLYEFREPFLASTYLGLGTLGFVAAALSRPREPRRLLLLALLAVSVLLALGRFTPLYGLAMQIVPPLRSFRFPSKLLIVAGFAWSLLAGLGFDEWRALRTRRTRLVVSASLLVGVLAAFSVAALARYGAEEWGSALLFRGENPHSFTEILRPVETRAVQAGLSALVVLVLSGALLRRRMGPQVLAACAAGVVLLDLAATHWRLHPTAARDLFLYRPPAVDAVRPGRGQRVYSYDYFVSGLSLRHLGHRSGYLTALWEEQWPFPGFEALALRGTLYPAVLGTWGLEAGYTTDPLGLFPGHLSRLSLLLLQAEGSPAHLRLLQRGGIGTVCALHRAGFESLTPVGTFSTLMLEPLFVFRVPDPLPRAFAVDGVRIADDTAALGLLMDAAFDPRREVALPAGETRPPQEGFSASVRETLRRPDRVQLEAELSGPGYVVLLDGYDPGWQVTVDGREASVLRANVTFRAVAVPAGRHVLEYRYRPRSVLAGAGLTALALLLAAAIVPWRKR
jgi:hypothetical protein